jgi:hypothetical protein
MPASFKPNCMKVALFLNLPGPVGIKHFCSKIHLKNLSNGDMDFFTLYFNSSNSSHSGTNVTHNKKFNEVTKTEIIHH